MFRRLSRRTPTPRSSPCSPDGWATRTSRLASPCAAHRCPASPCTASPAPPPPAPDKEIRPDTPARGIPPAARRPSSPYPRARMLPNRPLPARRMTRRGVSPESAASVHAVGALPPDKEFAPDTPARVTPNRRAAGILLIGSAVTSLSAPPCFPPRWSRMLPIGPSRACRMTHHGVSPESAASVTGDGRAGDGRSRNSPVSGCAAGRARSPTRRRTVRG